MPAEVLEWFNRYKLCQILGQGGMGSIYLAQDRLNNNVQRVIKQLMNKYNNPSEQAEAVRLFQREAAILRNLHHPGIVRHYDDYATEDGHYFLVMDYVLGKNLEEMLESAGVLTQETCVKIAIQCCEVLEYLHNQDPPIIFRDLKPSNLILTPDGNVVFIDFGIARTLMPKLAATRVVTAGYSPPEQYAGKPETRSDLYSLGATICHLLTGIRPKPLTVCSPNSFNVKVLPSLDLLIRKLMAHKVEDRPPNAQIVRWVLYKIYKELHPDFEIPQVLNKSINEESDFTNKMHAEESMRLLAKFRAGLFHPGLTSSAQQNLSESKHDFQIKDVWTSLKNWVHILMS